MTARHCVHFLLTIRSYYGIIEPVEAIQPRHHNQTGVTTMATKAKTETMATKAKTETMATKTKTELATAILSPARAYLEGAHGAGIAESKLKELLLNWKYDYAAWEKVREAFVSQKPLDMTSNTANAQWARLVKSFGLKKPASKSADAITKAANREKAAKVLADVDDVTLAKRIQLLEDNGLSAIKLKAEQKRRQAEKDAPVKEAKDKTLAAIKAALSKADLKTLEKIHKLLKLA